MELNYTINDLNEVIKTLLDTSNSKIFLFHGTMGVGKTTLIKALVRALGSEDEVQSPTYSLVNEYQAKDSVIYHFDLYRVNTLEEMYNFGFEEYFHGNPWVFIEWPELALDLISGDSISIYITLNEDNSRKIKIERT